MAQQEEKGKKNLLAALHLLMFSKTGKDDVAIVDIERRCIMVKYISAKEFDSAETAAGLLRKGLESYQILMEDKNGVNNYYKQFKAQMQAVENDPRKWKPDLEDVDIILNSVKPLPCQQNNSMLCKQNILIDEDVESIIDIWNNEETEERSRKITQEKSKPNQNVENDCKLRQNDESASLSSQFLSSIHMEDHGGEITNTNKRLFKSYPLLNENQNIIRQKSIQVESRFQHKSKEENISASGIQDEQSTAHKINAKFKPQASYEQGEEDLELANKISSFKSARDELNIQQMKSNRQGQKKTLGGKALINTQFVCPFKKEKEKELQSQNGETEASTMDVEDDRLKNIEPKMVELIKNEIMDSRTTVTWDDIAGLEFAKRTIREVVVYPMLRPDIFTGLRRPPKGILLFGPPGTGKTLIGKCIASQSKSTFFSISASSLTSKWIGEGEKMVRALFAVARVYQPSVIFIDEIDSLLTQRSETEHESSRRLKTEFLVQLDGAATAEDDRILIVGATNRPQELDEAARRRLVKRLYVPLPELEARKQIINKLLRSVQHNLSEQDITDIAEESKGYSGADMTNLCKEASMGPIRSIPFSQLEKIKTEDVRHVTINDFKEALIRVRPSVSESSLTTYVHWDTIYGTGTAQNYTI